MFTTTDPLKRKVTCSASTWFNHIFKGHVIMEDNIDSVKSTIENPDVIYQSSQSPARDVYFSKTEATYNPLLTKVIVEFNKSGESGQVISAWPQKDISGGIEDPGGIKYVKSKL
ncbi:MAG: hypothetical protein GX981_06115 [Tissierellia bacterium]|nr:hypothetical protein [Tissierellia bacterium]